MVINQMHSVKTHSNILKLVNRYMRNEKRRKASNRYNI